MVKIEEGLDTQFRRLPGRVLEDGRSELSELCERLFQLKGNHEHILDSLYEARYLSDPETLQEALRSGELRSATYEMQRHSLTTMDIFDGACLCFLSALMKYATALAHEEINPNVMWCALLGVGRDISSCTIYLEFMSVPGQSKRRLTSLASPAEAGAMGGDQHGRNHLLVRTQLALLLYQKCPANGWKDSMQAVKDLKEPLQRFIEDNRIRTLGPSESWSLEDLIINWIDNQPDVRKAFKATRRTPSA